MSRIQIWSALDARRCFAALPTWIAIAALLFAASPALAGLTVSFPERMELGGRTLERAGAAHLRVGWVFAVYDAAYYVESGATPEGSLTDDLARRLEIHYLRSIKADQFIAYADKALRTYLSADRIAALTEPIERINQAYRDVAKGDVYTLTYLPGDATELALNGEVLVRIPGADFARDYFRIWTDETNPYREFRDRLLGVN